MWGRIRYATRVATVCLAAALPWLAEAAEIGANDFRISNMGPDGNTNISGAHPDTAYNSADHEYLVVWSGDDDTPTADERDLDEIFGQRIDAATGDRVGPRIRISQMGPENDGAFNALQPRVAYNATDNEYLVVWVGDTNEGLLVDDEAEIFGQRLDGAGNELGGAAGDDFRVSLFTDLDGNPDFRNGDPELTYNPVDNEYLVVWTADTDEGSLVQGEFEIYGQRIGGGDGAFIVPFNFRISNMASDGDGNFDADESAVAHNAADNEYLVVWSGTDDSGSLIGGEHEIFGQRLSGAGEVGTDFRISSAGADGDGSVDAIEPAVAWGAAQNEYLVTWHADADFLTTDDQFEIFAEVLDASGAEIDGEFRVSQMGPIADAAFDARRVDVAYNVFDDEYLLVWDADDDSGSRVDGELEIHGQRIDAETRGEIGPTDFRLSDMGADGSTDFFAAIPAVTYGADANEFLVVWYGDDDTGTLVNDEVEVFGQRFSSRGRLLVTEAGDDDPAIGNGECSLREAVIAANGDTVVDTCDGSVGGPAHEIRFDPALAGSTILLDRTGAGEDAADTGDLDVLGDDLLIVGPTIGDPSSIILDGNAADRVLDLRDPVRLDLANLTVRGGLAELAGGGIRAVSDSRLVLTDAAVLDNQAGPAASPTFPGVRGGGIFTLGDARLVRTRVAGNRLQDVNSGAGGAGISVLATPDDGTLEILDSRITGNSIVVSGGLGGAAGAGILSNEGPVTIAGSEISGNQIEHLAAESDTRTTGGGFSFSPASASNSRIVNTTISGNRVLGADGDVLGGGLYYDEGDPAATLRFNNVTVTDNAAGGTVSAGAFNADGGGTFVAEGEIVLANSLIAGNSAEGGDPDCGNPTTGDPTIFYDSGGHNLVGVLGGCLFDSVASDQVGTNADPIDPLLASLADNGGSSFTHALTDTSPAIDAGTPETAFSGTPCEADDQRGEPRPFDGDGDGDAACDIGAFELAAVDVEADLVLAKGDMPDPVASGSTLTYTVQVTNNGPATATGVEVEDVLPAGVTLAATSGCVEDPAGVPNCTLGDLPAGGSAQYTIEVIVNAAGGSVLDNQAFASTESVDPVGMNNLDQEGTQVVAPGDPGVLQFVQAAHEVDEDAGTAVLTVERVGGSSGEVSVDFASSEADAVSPEDFGAVTDTLVFADGVTSRTITVPIADDGAPEGQEDFNVALNNPQGGALLGSPDSAEVTIRDDDQAQALRPIPALGWWGAAALGLGLLGIGLAAANILGRARP